MKDIQLNKLDANQRKLLQIGVVILLAIFLGFYFFFQLKSKPSTPKNNEVFLKDTKLQVFNDTYTFNGYPDRILIHYPYFLFVQGNKPLTTIYNLETKQKEKEIQDVLLDYYDGNIVYNRKETYFNDKNLGEYCDAAFIKSNEDILCITKQSQNYVDNMLISINPETPNLWKRLYQSDNVLTTVSIINGDLYVGEINFESKKSYLSVNEKSTPVENIVSLIYEMGGNPYFASLKSALNNNTESYYLIEDGHFIKQPEDKISLYR
ncbi:hypothetical protein A2982_00750 [candidate division WWE3 bacterium RIFCSPLOWO2_01_FULL_39_13]|uniref:GerMN domain-containing protein n=1 Tax=candidate division WWE3 bacterium RIFCSPLOWO2_01_FULL_39_13 TaxID=1802624 RepID=A0A1F4V5B2_UNCKA|nr:MAG: hypothetical protein A2982_00750 [candidate division WWE3 bacterium RIFCSPLOWO2_01_FULL_39_13]